MAFTYSKALSLSSGNNVFVSCAYQQEKVVYMTEAVFIKTGEWSEKKRNFLSWYRSCRYFMD